MFNKSYRILSLIIVISMLATIFTGCSKSVSNEKVEKEENVGVVVQKCNEYASQFKFNEAREFLLETLEKDNENYEALQSLAELDRFFYHDYNNSEKLIKNAIKLKPEDWMNHMILGDIYSDIKSYENAIDSYKNAIELNKVYKEGFWDKNISKIYFSIGNCYLGLGNKEKMLENYKIAVDMNPYNLKLNATLHKFYIENEEYEKAYEVWRRDNLLDSGIRSIGNYGKWDAQYKRILADKSSFSHFEMGKLYQEILLYDEAKIELGKAHKLEVDNKEIENRLNEVTAFVTFKDEIKSYFDSYYRNRSINGEEEELNIHTKIAPIYEKIAVIFDDYKDIKIRSLNDIKRLDKEIEEKFKVKILYGDSNADNVFGCWFGYIVGDDFINVNQWEKEGKIRSIVLKNMISNHRSYWTNKEEGGTGGWNISPEEIITVIDTKYSMGIGLGELVLDKDKRKEYLLRYGKDTFDIKEKLPTEIFFSYSLFEELTFKELDDELIRLQKEGYSKKEIEKYIFNRIVEHWYYVSTIIHEGQHAIDGKSVKSGELKITENWEFEYRAKLSELAYGEMQFYRLINYYHPAIGTETTSHYKSDTMLFKDIIQYIYDNKDRYPEIDINKNIMMQIPNLSSEKIREIAISIFEDKYKMIKQKS